jgi:simple sugar transport system permease protein
VIESPAAVLATGKKKIAWGSVFFPLLALLGALLLCALFVRLAGQDPVVAGKALLEGALGTSSRRAESLSKTIPLIMTGLAVVVAFRAGFWNIGAEGQLMMGALVAAGLGTRTHLPYPVVVLGGGLAGLIWALIAGWLKVQRRAPEIITTIMLNYIAIQLAVFAVQGPLQERAKAQPQTDVLYDGAQLPVLIADTNLHAGLFVALAAAFLCWWLFYRTERGFLIRAAGENPVAARVAGISIEKNTYFAVALSGFLAGLGGAMEIAGATKQLGLNAFGYGYTAIVVALLASLNPLGVIPAALLFGMLSAGGGAMERSANVPAVTVSILTGLLIFLVAALPRLRGRGKK